MGSAAAYWLGKSGKKIILIDQYSVGNDLCSSSDVNRVFRYAYGSDEFYTRLAIESRKLWKEVEKETRTTLLIPSGLLLLQGQDDGWNKFNVDSHKTIQKMHLESEELDRKELSKRYPLFEAEKAFLDHYGAAILARKALTTFADNAVKNGAKLLGNTAVAKVSATRERTVKILTENNEQITADRAIITIGPWSNNLLPEKIIRIKPTRQQILYFQPPDLEPYRAERFPVFFAESYYGIPAAGIDAVKVSHSGRDTPVTPETAKRSTDPEETDACRSILQRFIPKLASANLASSKVCLYDMTLDKDFVIGPDPEHEQILYGYGFSGHGFKFAPLIGRTLARLALEEDPGFEIQRFDPFRSHPQ